MLARRSSWLLLGNRPAVGRLLRAPVVMSRKSSSAAHTDDANESADENQKDLNGANPIADPSYVKVGSSSPWATDAWDAATAELEDGDDAMQQLLSDTSVAIPMSKAEAAGLPSQSSILSAYEAQLQRRSARHLGYPYNLNHSQNDDLARFMRYSINNLGDPYVTSNYGVHSREFEVAVVDFFAKLWKAPADDYWGYVTTCGTEGNLHAMLLAREAHPDGVLYTSSETHYTIFKVGGAVNSCPPMRRAECGGCVRIGSCAVRRGGYRTQWLAQSTHSPPDEACAALSASL